jgi:hypothetical protein
VKLLCLGQLADRVVVHSQNGLSSNRAGMQVNTAHRFVKSQCRRISHLGGIQAVVSESQASTVGVVARFFGAHGKRDDGGRHEQRNDEQSEQFQHSHAEIIA